MSNPVAVWDFTWKKHDEIEEDWLKERLNEVAKNWVFQLEEGKSGYVHWQGRMTLFKKARKKSLIKIMMTIDKIFKDLHVTPTSNNARRGEAFYVMKAQTRVKGPWKHDDPKPPYIPRQIREIKELRPFQKQIIDSVKVWDTRTINFVWCPKGNNGKSTLVGYLRAHQLARVLPPMNDQKDMMRMVCDLPTSTCYIIDMPRAMKKEKLYGFWAAIETVKDGYAYDDRYSFKEKVFDCPNIWVFGNVKPDFNVMSTDRWKVWTVTDSYELIRVPTRTQEVVGVPPLRGGPAPPDTPEGSGLTQGFWLGKGSDE